MKIEYFLCLTLKTRPKSYIMFSPSDAKVKGCAKERGFGTYSNLGDRWSLLGRIESLEDSKSQWVSAVPNVSYTTTALKIS